MCELAKFCFSLRLQEVHPSASALHAPLAHTLVQWVSVGVTLFWRLLLPVCVYVFLYSGFYVMGFALEECGSLTSACCMGGKLKPKHSV